MTLTMYFSIFFTLIFFSNLKLNSCLTCYECTSYVSCGSGQTHAMVNCPGKCLVYQNQFDGNTIIRRCCYNNCANDGKQIYEGRTAYICSTDLCNANEKDHLLIDSQESIEEGSGDQSTTTTTTTSIPTKPPPTTTLSSSSTTRMSSSSSTRVSSSSLLSCYDCTEHNSLCGISSTSILHNCRMCMVYRNQWDQNGIVRRCCYSNCGPSGSVQLYESRQTYFCSSNLCNQIGSETKLP